MSQIKFEVRGHSVGALDGPYLRDGAPTTEARAYAEKLIGLFDEMRRASARRYLQLYNGTWREEDDPELDETEFRARLVDPSIVLMDELGSACVYFEDSDMFAGHSLQVSMEDDRIADVSLVG